MCGYGCCWICKPRYCMRGGWCILLELYVMLWELISVVGIISIVIRFIFITFLIIGVTVISVVCCPLLFGILIFYCCTRGDKFCFEDKSKINECLPSFSFLIHKLIFGSCSFCWKEIVACEDGIFGCIFASLCVFWACEREIAGLCCAKLLKKCGYYDFENDKVLLSQDYTV